MTTNKEIFLKELGQIKHNTEEVNPVLFDQACSLYKEINELSKDDLEFNSELIEKYHFDIHVLKLHVTAFMREKKI